jgi:hypothetical protein
MAISSSESKASSGTPCEVRMASESRSKSLRRLVEELFAAEGRLARSMSST